MKKAIITLLTIIVFISAMSGCTQVGADSKKRFEKINTVQTIDGKIGVVYDTKTGVEYAYISTTSGTSSLTVLLNADGTPVVYKGE